MENVSLLESMFFILKKLCVLHLLQVLLQGLISMNLKHQNIEISIACLIWIFHKLFSNSFYKY